MSPTYLSLPSYFSTHSTSDLYDPRKTPFSYSHNSEGKTFYQVLTDDPVQHEIFNRGMKQQEPFLPTLGMYPFSSLREEVEAEKDRPFMVDVGGGRGHMLNIISKDTDGGFGAPLILQDRPEVLESVSQADIPGIQKMAHDFYTPQPVKSKPLCSTLYPRIAAFRILRTRQTHTPTTFAAFSITTKTKPVSRS